MLSTPEAKDSALSPSTRIQIMFSNTCSKWRAEMEVQNYKGNANNQTNHAYAKMNCTY
jgi:hypothetical protein